MERCESLICAASFHNLAFIHDLVIKSKRLKEIDFVIHKEVH